MTDSKRKPTAFEIAHAFLNDPPEYVFAPGTPLPKRWKDRTGPIRVMCEPVEGYVMVRRPGAMPFVLHVSELLNQARHPTHGPFRLCDPINKRTANRRTDHG